MDLSALLRHRLAAERRAGRPFVEAWADALAALPRPRSSRELVDELEALHATRSAWQRAYDGQAPTAAERAAGRLPTITPP